MTQECDTSSSMTHVTTSSYRRVSWGAVFAGLVIGLAIQLLLSFLGVAIGASSIDPLRGDTPGKGIAVGAGIWLLITGLISTYIGACIAAHLSGATRRQERMLHGLLTWGVTTLLTAFLLTSAAGNLIGGAMRVAGQAAGSGGAQALAQSQNQSQLSGQANMNAETAKGGTGQQTEKYVGTSAREAGDTAAKVTSAAAWWSFVMLLLGMAAAALGGGRKRHYAVSGTSFDEQPVR